MSGSYSSYASFANNKCNNRTHIIASRAHCGAPEESLRRADHCFRARPWFDFEIRTLIRIRTCKFQHSLEPINTRANESVGADLRTGSIRRPVRGQRAQQSRVVPVRCVSIILPNHRSDLALNSKERLLTPNTIFAAYNRTHWPLPTDLSAV